MKGVAKIKWSGKGKVDPTKSKPNISLCVLGKNDIGFVVDKWLSGTTEEQKKKNVIWILQDSNRKEIKRIQKTVKEEFTINIPNALCGPYSYYLEASLFGSIDRKNETGLWIIGSSAPRIVTSKWSVSVDGDDVRKQQFKYGQLIYLSLETEGLNGSKNLTIEIYKFIEGSYITGSKDDKLVATITGVEVIDGEVNLKIGNTANWFIHAKEDEEKFYIKVKTSWGKYVSDGKNEIHARFLRMKKEQVTKAIEASTNNTPLKIGDNEKSFLNYNGCRYDSITASYAKTANKEGNEEFKLVVFNSKRPPSSNSSLIFPVIAGSRQGRRELTLKLDSKTNQCQYDGLPSAHKTKVIDLSRIEEAIVIESKTKVNNHKVYDKSSFSSYGLNFGKEEEGHVDTDDDNEISDSHTTNNNSANFGGLGVSRSSKTTLFQDKKILAKDTQSDTEVLLDIGYNYGDESILTLVKYIWPLNKNVIQHYPIFLRTCAFEKKLDIQVYPDIKWILQFAYDCDPEEFQEMRSDKYDEYLVRVEKLDSKSKPLELEDRIKNLDSEIAQAKFDKNNSTEKKKKSYDKLIKKLEKLNKKNKDSKDKYNKKIKNHRKIYKKERPDLFDFKENIESGLSDLVLGLHVEYDRPGESLEITGSYKKYVNLVKQILTVKETIELILNGKKKAKKKLDKKYKQIDEKKASENLKLLGDALKGRPVFTLNIIPPSLAVVGSWYAENPKDINSQKIGIVGEIDVLAKPLIGAEGVLDFLGLAQKAHPIARGIVTLIDVGAATGIGPKITLELVISGQIEISGKWRGNSSSGTTNFNQKALATDAEDDSPLTVSGVFSLEIGGKIEISKKANSFFFGTIKGYANAAFEVKTGITLSGAIKADNKGVFIDPLLTFHGLTVAGIASAGYVAENSDGGEYSSGSIEGSFELVLMNEYEGSFEDSLGKKIQWYI